MKNSNPVSPVILEGAPAEITISNASAVTQLLNPEVSNYSVTTSGVGAKTITLVRPVSNEATRRLIAKNGCMITFFGKSISGGTVTINFESGAYEDITVASTPVTSHTLTQGEYITFVFVRDTWRLMSEISPSSLSSVSTLNITGNAANSLAVSSESGGITVSGNSGTINLSGTSSQLKFTNASNNGYAIDMAAGASIRLAQGNFETTSGNFTTTSGYFYSASGYVQAGKGFINNGSYRDIIQDADILSLTGTVSATGFNAKTKLVVVTGAAAAAVTITLPALSTVLTSSETALGTLVQGTTFYFCIVNNVPANGTVTIAGAQDKIGPMTVTANHSGMFAYRFTGIDSGNANATVYRVA